MRYLSVGFQLLALLLIFGCTPLPDQDKEAGPAADGGPVADNAVTGDSAVTPDSAPPDSAVAPDSAASPDSGGPAALSYVINDTDQSKCYDNKAKSACPKAGAFFGQDAQYTRNKMAFKDNGDGTVTALNTGLIWAKAQGAKVSWQKAVAGAKTFKLAGHTDWRLPSAKELYSLIDFNGSFVGKAAGSKPYIKTKYFGFKYGDTSAGEKESDAQYASATEYVDTTMHGYHTVFGVNFANGRLAGYPSKDKNGVRLFAVRYVRGNKQYGKNTLVDNKDGTITDKATGLMWQQADSGKAMKWQPALAACEGLTAAGKSDWRLPNAKELQSIVDYTRAPSKTKTAALDPLFKVTAMESYFWTGTTHLDGQPGVSGSLAVYIAFGQAKGHVMPPMGTGYQLLDVHGAGAQRSDPKTGDPKKYPKGHGPQGDQVRILNHVRCVRDAK